MEQSADCVSFWSISENSELETSDLQPYLKIVDYAVRLMKVFSDMTVRHSFGAALIGFILSCGVLAQGNGKLQFHFIDVGQGDGAILISPGGQVVAFDIGQDLVHRNCDKPESYYDQLGITKLVYLFVSHYHQDHIGCVPEVLKNVKAAWVIDRGLDYKSTFYDSYVAAIGAARHTGSIGQTFVLDEGTPQPVTLRIVEVDAKGLKTTNENDLSLSVRIEYGAFRAEIGGDLSGDNNDDYINVESTVAADVGKLDLYKVHHHCSSHSSNDDWLAATKPTVGIVSAGDGNTFGHPASDCLERLHSAGAKTYWTEAGNGGEPEAGQDSVAGNILVNVDLAANIFTVTHGTDSETYAIGAPNPIAGSSLPKYAWSTHSGSKVYHYATCQWVQNISADNLARGNTPPDGKTLHENCPRLNHPQ